jgi:hypothetical protein
MLALRLGKLNGVFSLMGDSDNPIVRVPQLPGIEQKRKNSPQKLLGQYLQSTSNAHIVDGQQIFSRIKSEIQSAVRVINPRLFDKKHTLPEVKPPERYVFRFRPCSQNACSQPFQVALPGPSVLAGK